MKICIVSRAGLKFLIESLPFVPLEFLGRFPAPGQWSAPIYRQPRKTDSPYFISPTMEVVDFQKVRFLIDIPGEEHWQMEQWMQWGTVPEFLISLDAACKR